MAQQIEVKVPDIGDFKDVAVIEVMVKPGETVAVDTSLIMVESDKASMEIPSSHAGIVKEVKVRVGDKVSEGSIILVLETAGAAAAPPPAPASKPAATSSAAAPVPASHSGKADIECEMLVLGAGPGGYSAAFRAADLGMKTVLVERYDTLGGVCLNVGCIPSKALLHTASVVDEVKHLPDHGISFGAPQIDLDKLRGFKDGVIKKLTGGLAGMAKARKVEVVTGVGAFLDPHHLEVVTAGGKKTIKFAKAIIAAGSQAVKLPFLPEDPRIVDSTGALLLKSIPKRMLVIGGGIIGLEMATVYSALGARIDVVEMLDGLMQGADRDLVKVWEKMNAKRFDKAMLKTKTVGAKATEAGIEVSFEGEQAPSGSQVYDLVLVAVGRSPNGKKIGAEKAGVAVTDRGFIDVDKQMRTNVAHIFAIGDIVGQPMLAHKAVHEGHVAAEVAHGEKSYFDARQIPSVAYTDPEVAWAGKTEDECKAEGIKFGKSVFPWAASGRAIANGRDEGFTKLLFDTATHRVIGGGIVGTHAGDLISEVCLAIEMGCEPADIGKTIHPHPTLGESIGMAAEVFEGHCTDLPPQKKK
ncbi:MULTISPECIES: dihydrolipoyl dehydrogenase [Bradyrhizobium]|uniref:Dihydrolipoyl dehydrogenase n=1 Tax=Bradyrhizobium diazoefficiens (strain JCM 10833 / BCRC 13528 / IAM 13628 / NBRC 14792 / USDA 110) TaxID=224911 RepID=Q89NW1_BRADU|nr:dihydrolipoyl dehydrogenase [Bradyrhizobium diazoefficiens]MBP1066335.1 dihydrolipoamide dehydrogenase [Bradyrhizobium japonicum]AND89054.1 dihydrolipoamide dehydrogenase [Bradyrhizobium diazoefficiens USDA 110]AWO90665.1 dihydrolipoyl dehydrogenase [Bradyrhizobium diazoefficiens]PDT60268.1 dihydrolipoyl dehydrogenase [Bradyrhizobium diazoefficiens]QBP22493.1 dihydrolipoyl dehydrogenase [Bradyrhizobium diazoefficiens]